MELEGQNLAYVLRKGKSLNPTVTLNSLNNSEDVPQIKDAWSKLVTQADVFVVPKNFVGVNEAKVGS